MASSKKKKLGLLGGLFKSGPKKPRKLTEEELRDEELVKEFYDKGLDLDELDKYNREKVGADDVLHDDDSYGDVKGSVYVISLKPFYECIGTRTGRLAEGLVDLCYKVMREKVGDNGTYSQQSADIFIFQFKDGVNQKNWKTAIEIINEVGTTFLGNNYNPKEIISDALGQGDAENILSNDGGAGLAAALNNITMNAQGKIQISSSSLSGGATPIKQSKTKDANWKDKDWENFGSGQGSREAQMIRVGEDKEYNPEWEKQGYDGLDPQHMKLKPNNTFRPKSLWVERNGERRNKRLAIQIQERRKKKQGRRVKDAKGAVIW